MKIVNDSNCGWLKQLPKRKNINVIKEDLKCDYLIIGAGFTGLSAARQLGEIQKNKKIIIIDAQLAGEGASSRNSGYLVDTTLNDGFTSNKKHQDYLKKVKIYEQGINSVKKFINEYQVDCDWNECGKYFASSKIEDEIKVKEFSKLLSKINYKNEILYQNDLKKRLGTEFYKVALYTYGGILINPAKLVRSMISALPQNVNIYENSTLIKWSKQNKKIYARINKHNLITDKIIFCSNGFLNLLGVKKRYSFPLTLTASMTRQLTEKEFESIGQPKEWGILPVRPMGATVRMTKDRRILIRNTVENKKPNFMDNNDLTKNLKYHKIGLKKRFPSLPGDIVENTWSGVVCRSGNGSQIFEKLDENIYVAGCYNGSGIGVGTLFGEQIALMASNQQSDIIQIIEDRKKPNWLPPQPFLNIGINSRLFYERLKANSEI